MPRVARVRSVFGLYGTYVLSAKIFPLPVPQRRNNVCDSSPIYNAYSLGFLIYLILLSFYLRLHGNQALVAIYSLVFPMNDTQSSSEFMAADNGPIVLGTAFSMIVSCTIFVILRYYSRYLSSTAFSIEDVIIPFAWLAEMTLCAGGICRQPHMNSHHFCTNIMSRHG